MTAAFQAAAGEVATQIKSSDDNPPRSANLSPEKRAALDAKISALNADLERRGYSFATEVDARDYLHSQAATIGAEYGVELGSVISMTTGRDYLVSAVRTDYYVNQVTTPLARGSIYLADWHNHPSSSTFSAQDISGIRHASYVSGADGSLRYFNYQAFMNNSWPDALTYRQMYVERLR